MLFRSTGDGDNAAATGIISGGQVTQVVVTNPGNGYTHGNVAISGGGGANATADLIVTSDDITGVQSFSGRVWVAQGRTVYYTSAASVSEYCDLVALATGILDPSLG